MKIISELTDELEPISRLAKRLLAENEECEAGSGRLQLARRRSVGDEAFAVTLFQGVEAATIKRYEKLCGLEIPDAYRTVLAKLNGAMLFQLVLYGLPPSMVNDAPTLDRTTLQPLDLATANRYWRHDFSSDNHLFQIGGGPWSSSENVGYFLSTDGAVRALRKIDQQVSVWPSIEGFLSHELARAEGQYAEFEKLIAQVRART